MTIPKLIFDYFHSKKTNNTSNEDLHHTVENNIDRPKDSRNSDDSTYFSDGLYLFDCTREWSKHRQKLKRTHSNKTLKEEEIPFKNFILDRHHQLKYKSAKIDSDHLAKRLLRNFQRYIDGLSHSDNKKYQKELLEDAKKRHEISQLDIDDEGKRLKLQQLKKLKQKDPKYFSLI